jgi:hypothetical protein
MIITEEINNITFTYNIPNHIIKNIQNPKEYKNLIITCRNLLIKEINKIGYLPENGIFLKTK